MQPEAYRFRVLNASNDRMWNLQLYTSSSIVDQIKLVSGGSGYQNPPAITITAAPGDTTGMGATAKALIDQLTGRLIGISLITVGSGYTLPPIVSIAPPPNGGQPATAIATIYTGTSEVGMVPAIPGAADFPVGWTVQTLGQTGDILDGRYGGVPDPRNIGPSMIQIGTEGGFLPTPVVLPNTPIGYERNPKNIVVGSVSQHTLLMGPAERADVIIDFSQYAGKTIILYNDAPAPDPATDSRLDYYTNDANQTSTGGTNSTRAGYGPNTRTIMVFHVANATPHPYNLQALMDEFTTTATHQGVFAKDQNPIIVPQDGYNSAYNAVFPNGVEAYARIQSNWLTFKPLDLTTPTKLAANSVTINFGPKAIQELFENDYGRMNGQLGVELPFTNGGNQTTIPYNYSDPVTEIINDTFDPRMTKIGELGDGTQIWKITHNGVDTHPVHFHLFDVQLINRVGWDGQVKPPDPNELGWKETVRMNPLEDCIVALRPTSSKVPFGVPHSVRLLDPSMPEGATWRTFDATTGNPITVVNEPYDFGWEYMWHCHILSHEEMMMMRPIQFNVATAAPLDTRIWRTNSLNHVDLAWIDPTPASDLATLGNPRNEIGWWVQRANLVNGVPGVYETIAALPANTTAYSDPTIIPNSGFSYRVVAYNASGNSTTGAISATGIAVTSTASGQYGAGESIPLVLTFSKAVNVTGTPIILLNSGGQAFYSSGSGTTTLRFLYRIANGESAYPLDYNSKNSLTLPSGAAINFVDGSGAANLTLPDPATGADGLWFQDIRVLPKELPTITWLKPADIVYGTPLDSTQLNATASVPGRFVYLPTSGTVLFAGMNQALSTTFTPQDTAEFMTVTQTRSINVLQASPQFDRLTASQSVTYGNASVSVSGRLRASTAIPSGQSVSVALGSMVALATTQYDGSFTVTFDTHALPASAAPYPITYNYGGDRNFTAASASSTSLMVNTRTLVLGANAASRIYGEADPVLTYQILSGSLVNGDTLVGNLARVPGTNVGSYPILQGTLTAGSNYALIYVAANLQVTPRMVTVAADPKSKIYGQPDPALTYRLTSGSLVPGDGFSGALTRTPGDNIGAYAILQGSLQLSNNYALSYIGSNLTITPLSVTTTTILNSSAATSSFGQPITFTAQVIPAGGASMATGSVIFMDGSTVLGTVGLHSSVATLSTLGLSVANHRILACYQGDSICSPSDSSTFSQAVTPAYTGTNLEVEARANRQGFRVEVIVSPAYNLASVPGSIVVTSNGRVIRNVKVTNGRAVFNVANRNILNTMVKATFKSSSPSIYSSVSKEVKAKLPPLHSVTTRTARPRIPQLLGASAK
ncbi:MAG: MBG domain-containing protein [Isosphaeraceae bacterium]